MAVVTVNGVVLWTSNIHGDAKLREMLSGLPGGEDVELVVNGVRGHWRKMADGRDGRSTPGLAPRGRMQTFWRELNRTRRGEDVPVDRPEQPDFPSIQPVRGLTDAERMAAFESFVEMASSWTSPAASWKFNRQELHDDRDDELEARRLRNR